MTEYNVLSDEELIELLRSGNDEVMNFLINKHKGLVRKKANALYLMGGETDDLIQEGMIGLFKSVMDYKSDCGTSFVTFASLCINRQLYTAIETASRKKNMPLNSYVSLSEGDDSNTSDVFMNIREHDQDPQQMMIDQENTKQLFDNLEKELSKLEKTVLDYYLDGLNYREIAQITDRSEKSIDNALQRIKKKMHQVLDKR